MAVPSVDVHAHVWLETVEQAAMARAGYADAQALEMRRLGASSVAESAVAVRQVADRLTTAQGRLATMDAVGVDVHVVSISPTQYHPWADTDLARDLSALTNAGVAAHCAQAPNRLMGLGIAPLQHPALAVEALDDAMLNHGLLGIEISSHAPDPRGGTVELSDRRLDAFWCRAEELGAIVFMHPWGCTLDERLDKWYMANSVGQPVEHAVALSHLIISGVLDRFPALRLIAAHGGGYLPAFMGRADHAWLNRRDARGSAELPSNYLTRIWFDSLVHSANSLRGLVATVGHDRVLLGSDYPYDMGEADPIAQIKAAGLPAEAEQAVIGGNAVALGLTIAATTTRRI